MLYCIEAWAHHLRKWVAVTMTFNVWRARDIAEILAETYRRPYRVTDEHRNEYVRFTGES